MNTPKFTFTNVLLAILLCLQVYNTYQVHKTKDLLDSNTIALTNSINNVAIDTNGKIKSLNDKTDSITKQTNTIIEKQVISYVEKESDNDADVEIKSTKPVVSVKVNDGQKYDFDLLPTEQSKMENGKLVITQGFSSNIDIRANEYKRSKWSLTTAMNSDKEVLGGLHYDLGHTVSASVYTGQGIKPYYGLTYRIGGHE